jgi:hypothetical protein
MEWWHFRAIMEAEVRHAARPQHAPVVQALARAVLPLAVVKCVRIYPQKAHKGVQLTHPVLERCAGQTPLVERVEVKHGLGGGCGSVLDHVCLVQDDSEPRYHVQNTLGEGREGEERSQYERRNKRERIE